MTKKTFLSKVLPASLVFILVLLLVVVISSCSRTKKTPTGGIEEVEDYISITLSNGEKVNVSKTKLYDQLRYIGYNSFAEELDGLVFADYVKAIKENLDTNATNLENSKYYDKFVDYVNETTYGTSDQDEIDKLTDKEKNIKEREFFGTLTISGNDFDEAKGIYQRAAFDFFIVELARTEYARSILTEKVKELDGEFEITDEDLSEYFKSNVNNKDDISAILIMFSSSTEIDEVLKALRLKFVKDKLYRVLPNPEEEDYDKTYNNFSVTDDGVAHLEDNEVLFEFAHIYNYMYSTYRPGLSLKVMADLTDDDIDNSVEIEILASETPDSYTSPILSGTYTDAEVKKLYAAIKNTLTTESMTSEFFTQDRGKTKDENHPKLTYTYDALYEYDSVITDDIYRKYLANDTSRPSYNTSSTEKFLVFKLADSVDVSYDNIKTLANFVDAVDNGNSEISIAQYLQELSEIFEGRLKSLGIFGDKEKTLNYFYGNGSTTGYANEITIGGITGAMNIIENAWNKEDTDSLFSSVFEGRLSSEYIDNEVAEFMEDKCEIIIYDELFEIQFAIKNSFYKKSNKQSKELVASVKVGEKTHDLTAQNMFEILEKRFGGSEAFKLVTNQILKDKYYDEISEDDLKDFDTEYEKTLTYFATGQSDQYGYPASIGQKAFIQLYFRADNKDEAIFNMWVTEKLQKLLLFEKSTDIYSNIYNDMRDLTILTYKNYFNLSYQRITIYTDDDEDGKKDDWTLVDNTDERKMQVKKAAAELMDVITAELKTYGFSSQNDAYQTIVDNYNKASRISKRYINVDPVPEFKTIAERNSYLWGKFKQLGLFVSVETRVVNSFETIDGIQEDALLEQFRNIYSWFKESNLIIDGSLAGSETFARKVELDENNNIIGVGDKEDAYDENEKAIRGDLCETESGFVLINITNADNAPSAKFLFGDNANDSVNGKLYPYSLNTDNPFPRDDEGNPISSYTNEDSLYNENDDATANQIQMYIREYGDGVESLSSSVITALETFFDAKVYSYFISTSFNYVICEKIMDEYITDNKITFKNPEILKSINSLIEVQKDALFSYETSEFIDAWWNIFD